MPTFEDWKRSYQRGLEDKIKYFKILGHNDRRAYELALIETNIIIKRAQDSLGERPPPFVVDNPDFYYPGEASSSENPRVVERANQKEIENNG